MIWPMLATLMEEEFSLVLVCIRTLGGFDTFSN